MSVVLNGHTYDVTDFTGVDGRGYNALFPATGLILFPNSIFTDMLAEMASAVSVGSVLPGAAGGHLRSNGSAWVRVSGVAASDVTAGTFAAGNFIFPGNLTTNGVIVATAALADVLTLTRTAEASVYLSIGPFVSGADGVLWTSSKAMVFAANAVGGYSAGKEVFACTTGGDLGLKAGVKIYGDGVAGTGNTYLQGERLADTWEIVCGGTARVTVNTTSAVLAVALTTDGGLQTFGANDSAGAGYRLVRVPNV